MTTLQVHFTLQYGVDYVIDQDWHLEQPVTRPWCSPLESAFKRLLEMQALSQHDKPGGYLTAELGLVVLVATELRLKAGRSKQVKFNSELDCYDFLEPHTRWCHQLELVLAR